GVEAQALLALVVLGGFLGVEGILLAKIGVVVHDGLGGLLLLGLADGQGQVVQVGDGLLERRSLLCAIHLGLAPLLLLGLRPLGFAYEIVIVVHLLHNVIQKRFGVGFG